MQLRKTYRGVNPQLLYDEVKDFILKQGTVIGESKLVTYLLPDNSSSFIFRGTLTFRVRVGQDKSEKECLRAHTVGTDKGETKLMLDINEELFPQEKVSALQDDLDFIFRSYDTEYEEEEK